MVYASAQQYYGEQQQHVKQSQNHWYEDIARLCKLNIEFDRNQLANEHGYRTKLYHLSHAQHLAKSHLLIGIPQQHPMWESVII